MPPANAGDASHREGVFDCLVRARTFGGQGFKQRVRFFRDGTPSAFFPYTRLGDKSQSGPGDVGKQPLTGLYPPDFGGLGFRNRFGRVLGSDAFFFFFRHAQGAQLGGLCVGHGALARKFFTDQHIALLRLGEMVLGAGPRGVALLR